MVCDDFREFERIVLTNAISMIPLVWVAGTQTCLSEANIPLRIKRQRRANNNGKQQYRNSSEQRDEFLVVLLHSAGTTSRPS